MRSVCMATCVSRSKKVSPTTRASIVIAKNAPMTHCNGVCSITSTKIAAITRHTESAPIVVAVIAALASRLRAPADVTPRGAALVEQLLRDGSSVLYASPNPRDVDVEVRAAKVALDASPVAVR